MPTLLWLMALYVVIMIAFSATSDIKFGIMTTVAFLCNHAGASAYRSFYHNRGQVVISDSFVHHLPCRVVF